MKSVLIVEDETLIRLGIRAMLEATGLQIMIAGDASDGREALDFMKRNPVDIVVTDIQMPIMNGLEFIEVCKQQYPDTVFLVLSSYEKFDYAQAAIRLGVKDYMLKSSMNVETFRASIRSILNSAYGIVSTDITEQSTNRISLLKEHILNNQLRRERPNLLPAESETFRYPFWEGQTHVCLIGPGSMYKGSSEQIQSLLQRLIWMIHDQSPTMDMEAISIRGVGILIFAGAGAIEENHWRAWLSEIREKIREVINVELHWEERASLQDWRQIRQFCQKLILNFRMMDQEEKANPILKAMNFMQDHFEEPISLNQVAAQIHMSSSQFSRMFKEVTGFSYIRYLSDLRFEKAKAYLEDSGLTAMSIGKLVGYPNPRYFSKWFKAMTGITPGEYRKLNSNINS